MAPILVHSTAILYSAALLDCAPQCQAGCGEQGERVREVVCLLGEQSSMDCREGERPPEKESCKGDPCVAGQWWRGGMAREGRN